MHSECLPWDCGEIGRRRHSALIERRTLCSNICVSYEY